MKISNNTQGGFLGSLGLQKTSSESYFTMVDASVLIKIPEHENQKYDYDTNVQLGVTFEIEFEKRSNGIKGATVSIRKIWPLEVGITNVETNEENIIRATIDPIQISNEQSPVTGFIGVGDMEIVMDVNGVVDYQQSKIETYGF